MLQFSFSGSSIPLTLRGLNNEEARLHKGYPNG
uniref:Uncharacterized protein n=1 Tax=Rhizophora mucronata TaxID=61149 RepID=A0A2P2QU22_RHIMU